MLSSRRGNKDLLLENGLTEQVFDLLIYSCLYLIHIVLNDIVMHLGACIDTNVLESFA